MLEQFLNYLRAIRGYSENTIKAYACDLHAFAGWMKENKAEARWSTTTREDIDSFLTYQQEQGYKPSTTNRQLAAIASLFRYFKRQGLDVSNPCQYEGRRKMAKTIPSTIPTSQISEAYRHATGLKRTMIGILATTGIRIQELLDMNWEDIDFESSTIIVKGKGEKERIVKTEATILEDLRRIKAQQHKTGKIFFISQRTARYMIYEALKPFCNCRELNPHAIRHTYATELAKQGESSMTIAKALGHAKIETSQKYVDMTQIITPAKGILLN